MANQVKLHNTNCISYYRQAQSLLPDATIQNYKYLFDLKKQLHEHEIAYPRSSFEDIENALGTVEDNIRDYTDAQNNTDTPVHNYTDADSSIVTKNSSTVTQPIGKKTYGKKIFWVILITAILFYITFLLYSIISYKDYQESIPHRYEDIIKDGERES